jgi:hypothetical protein
MRTSQGEGFFAELAAGHSGPQIPEAKRVYFQTRTRNRIFNYLLGLFVREQEKGLTKAQLARRTGHSPETINRWLGAPSNLTIDSISDLLLGIVAEELTPQSEPLLNQTSRLPQSPWLRDTQVIKRSDPESANNIVELRSWKKAS